MQRSQEELADPVPWGLPVHPGSSGARGSVLAECRIAIQLQNFCVNSLWGCAYCNHYSRHCRWDRRGPELSPVTGDSESECHQSSELRQDCSDCSLQLGDRNSPVPDDKKVRQKAYSQLVTHHTHFNVDICTVYQQYSPPLCDPGFYQQELLRQRGSGWVGSGLCYQQCHRLQSPTLLRFKHLQEACPVYYMSEELHGSV